MLKRFPFLWCYAYPNAMVDHNFNDDVALCFALTHKRAVKKFSRIYNLNPKTVSKVYFNFAGIAVLTDY